MTAKALPSKWCVMCAISKEKKKKKSSGNFRNHMFIFIHDWKFMDFDSSSTPTGSDENNVSHKVLTLKLMGNNILCSEDKKRKKDNRIWLITALYIPTVYFYDHIHPRTFDLLSVFQNKSLMFHIIFVLYWVFCIVSPLVFCYLLCSSTVLLRRLMFDSSWTPTGSSNHCFLKKKTKKNHVCHFSSATWRYAEVQTS